MDHVTGSLGAGGAGEGRGGERSGPAAARLEAARSRFRDQIAARTPEGHLAVAWWNDGPHSRQIQPTDKYMPRYLVWRGECGRRPRCLSTLADEAVAPVGKYSAERS